MEVNLNVDQLKSLIQQPLWDKVTIGNSPAVSKVEFFRTLSGKNEHQTNIKREGGMLESGQEYYIKGFRAVFDQGSKEIDMKEILNKGLLVFKKSDYELFRMPLVLIPAGCGLVSFSTIADVQAAINGEANINNFYKLTSQITIEENKSVIVELLCPYSGGFTLTAPINLMIVFEGFMKKHAIVK